MSRLICNSKQNPIFKLKMLSDSSLEAELALKAFTLSDTRPNKDTKFREIIPASRHVGHQLMISFSMSGDPSDRSSLALITVDLALTSASRSG